MENRFFKAGECLFLRPENGNSTPCIVCPLLNIIYYRLYDYPGQVKFVLDM